MDDCAIAAPQLLEVFWICKWDVHEATCLTVVVTVGKKWLELRENLWVEGT